MNHFDELNKNILCFISCRQLIFMTMLKLFTMIFDSSTLSIICHKPQGVVLIQQQLTLHLTFNYCNRTKDGWGRKAEPLQEEVVIGTIWVKPCNPNSGYRSARLYTIPVACSPALPNTVSLTSLLQCQIDAQTSNTISSANCWDLFTVSSGASAAQCEL